jgi:hypothetical protein
MRDIVDVTLWRLSRCWTYNARLKLLEWKTTVAVREPGEWTDKLQRAIGWLLAEHRRRPSTNDMKVFPATGNSQSSSLRVRLTLPLLVNLLVFQPQPSTNEKRQS